MSLARTKRESKRQLGQFLTPIEVARRVLAKIEVNPNDVVFEPSFGKGVFLIAYIERLAQLGVDIGKWAETHAYGCEIDPVLFRTFMDSWKHGGNFVNGDFFRYEMPSYKPSEYFKGVREKYNLIVGNPPFGGQLTQRYRTN